VGDRELNSVSQRKECMSELFWVKEEHARRAHQNNSQNRRGISRLLNTLEINFAQEEA
jgi:hypothetical protein